MKLVRSALALLILIPLAVLFGWVINNVYLTRIVPSFTAMNPVTAVCFILIAIALAVHVFNTKYADRYMRMAGLVVLTVGGFMLVKYLFNIDVQIDRVLFTDALHTNRIAPNTALNFTLTGIALLVFSQARKWLPWGVIVITGFISILSLIGYLYGLKELFGTPGFTPMAVHTATCFILTDLVLISVLLGSRTLYVNKKIIAVLLLTVGLVIGVSLSTVRTLQHATDDQEHIVRTHLIIEAVNDELTALVDAETGQRGYLLTKNTDYLQPYNQAKGIIDVKGALLKDLLIKDGKDEALASEVDSLVKQKMQELDLTIRLAQANKLSEALRIVNSNIGKQYLDGIRSRLASIEHEEQAELASIQADSQKRRQDTLWVLALVTAMDGLLILGAFLFIQRSIKVRLEAEQRAEDVAERLQVEKTKDEALLNSIGDAVFAIDAEQRITLFNPVAEKLSGYKAAEAIGRLYHEVLAFRYEKTGKVNDRFVREALSGRLSAMSNHTVLARRDGSTVQVADSAAPILAPSGVVEGVIVVFRDISKEYELDKAKTEFVSLASHQLRTPLAAMRWYGEMLLKGDAGKMTSEQSGFVQEMFDCNERMMDLVGSLLDVSRLDLGKLTNQPEPTDIGKLIQSLEKELTVSIESKKLVMSRDIKTPFPLVEADPKLLRMVLQNLLSNAVKYTDNNGNIAVTLRKAVSADLAIAKLRKHQDYWYFSIKDSGYGIPQEQQSKIFGKLFRADNVTELPVEGTGLGLYIVKEVIEKLGGRVWFESVEGVGTTFYVVAPFTTKRRKYID